MEKVTQAESNADATRGRRRMSAQALEHLDALAEKTRERLEAMKAEGWDVSMLEEGGSRGG